MIDAPLGDPRTWQIGNAKVTRIIEMETIGGQEWIMPKATRDVAKSVEWMRPHFADEKGRMKFAIQLMVVDAPGVRIAIDTCVGNDKKRPLPNWDMRTGPFLEHLRMAGIAPESVTHVYCTHLHTDHIGWNTMKIGDKWVPTFPNAKYLFGRKEFEFWTQGGRSGETGNEHGIEDELYDSILPIVDAGLQELVEFDHVIFDDREGTKIYIRPTLGHTPGHTSLMIESLGRKALVTGDCFHHPIQFTEPVVGSRADTNSAQAVQTREDLMREFCGTSTLVFGTHFARPTCGTVVPYKKNYRLDTEAGNAFLAKLNGAKL
jgi:glyoxylase-like metal-dependent hydrolase (beta-lactamase superfamily II)